MITQLLANEPMVRLACFMSVFTGMVIWEHYACRRPLHIPRRLRWPHNLMLVILDTALIRTLFPVAAVGAAYISAEQGWGIFNHLTLPLGLAIIASVIILDLIIYFQHRIFHYVPWLWRLHRMHHTDTEFDVTTALRFHPLEILISMLIKLGATILLGAPPVAVMIFEILLNATAMFNHGNVKLPLGIDRYLRYLLVTPDMHRVHHSIVVRETNSNFGFNLPWWDRLFGTYIEQPAAGHQEMVIGLKAFRSVDNLRLDRLLIQPFIQDKRDQLQ